MKKKLSFYICSIIIIASNIVMATVINSGEEIVSNIFLIVITAILIPGFLWAINNEKTSLIRVESSALLMLAIISILRLINRIDTLPPIVNSSVILVAFGLGILLLIVTIMRMVNKKH